jgi:tetratricopeptide (TPR) repeat protein
MRPRHNSNHKVGLVVAALAWGCFGAPPTASASGGERIEPTQTLLGSYLAGRFARSAYDTTAAVEFYRQAISRDPDSDLIVEQAFVMEAIEGNFEHATELARKVVASKANNRLAQTWLGVAEFKAGNFDAAETRLSAVGSGAVGELTGILARAWLRLAKGDTKAALALLDGGPQAQSVQAYLRYHRALIADVAGRRSEARQAYERSFKGDSRSVRLALAYARHASHADDAKLARSVLSEHLEKVGGEGHPAVRSLRSELQSAANLPLLIEDPVDGFAEVFFGLGEALAGDGAVSLAAAYLQMSLYVNPNAPFALAALGSVYEVMRRNAKANEIYDRIPSASPLRAVTTIRKAINLNLLDQVEESKLLLEAHAKAHPDELAPLDTLGTIMRARKRYAEAIDYYSHAIALIKEPQERHWHYWYSRGTCYERVKRWSQAEADLKRALQLSPEEPLILNYLGYSWIDQNRNLKQGLAMIQKAVSKRQNDGFIVDSLGWAYYRLGNYREAVRFLERAVELKPEDPTLNDHLGDALWRVGRKREAHFQWDQALTLKPEPEEAEKISEKLLKGLVDKTGNGSAKKPKEQSRSAAQRKPVETKLERAAPFQ